jgi:hypothetical protein
MSIMLVPAIPLPLANEDIQALPRPPSPTHCHDPGKILTAMAVLQLSHTWIFYHDIANTLFHQVHLLYY